MVNLHGFSRNHISIISSTIASYRRTEIEFKLNLSVIVSSWNFEYTIVIEQNYAYN